MARKYWVLFSLFALIVLPVLFLSLARSVAIPFLLALLLAYFLDPAADALERRGASRSLAVVTVFAAFVLSAGVLLVLLVPAIKKELVILQASLPRYVEAFYGTIPDPVLEALGITGREDIQTLLSRAYAGLKDISFDVVNQVAVFLSRAFSSTLQFLLAVLGYFIIPIYLFYLLRDFDRLREKSLALVPPRHRPAVISLSRDVDGVLSGFIRGQLTVCLILAALYSLGLALVGVDLALLIGIVSGLAFIIPYLGTLFGIVAGSIMAAVEFRDLLHPAMVIGWFALVQGVEGTIITPKIVGDRVGLSPLATILAVLIGGELFGFLGLLLAVPVTASLKVLLDHLLEHYRRSVFFNHPGPGEDHA